MAGASPGRLMRPLRGCLHPGCPELVTSGYCTAHARPAWQRLPITTTGRGYGAAWRRLRSAQIAHQPDCEECGAPATEVDHIVPKAQGGSDHPTNLQSLCAECHDRKTAREALASRRSAVMVVAGPPCAGKTTWVSEHAEPADAVLDYDLLASALAVNGEAQPGHHALVLAAFYGVLRTQRETALGCRLWVPTGAPHRDTRQRYRELNGAHVLVLETPADVCQRRARERFGAGPLAEEYIQAIARWWNAYQPDPRDRVVSGTGGGGRRARGGPRQGRGGENHGPAAPVTGIGDLAHAGTLRGIFDHPDVDRGTDGRGAEGVVTNRGAGRAAWRK